LNSHFLAARFCNCLFELQELMQDLQIYFCPSILKSNGILKTKKNHGRKNAKFNPIFKFELSSLQLDFFMGKKENFRPRDFSTFLKNMS
jgi:hypothetical protein